MSLDLINHGHHVVTIWSRSLQHLRSDEDDLHRLFDGSPAVSGFRRGFKAQIFQRNADDLKHQTFVILL